MRIWDKLTYNESWGRVSGNRREFVCDDKLSCQTEETRLMFCHVPQ